MKNFNSQLIRQIGEHLVVAELGRRGIIATPFAGNVPDIDILAYRDGTSVPIQVKSLTKGAWSMGAERFIKISWNGDTQIVEGLRSDIDRNLIYVCVVVGDKSGEERFFLLTQGELQHIIHDHYKAFLAKHGGVRPRNPQSTHVGVQEEELAPHRDRWSLIADQFAPKP